MELQESTNRVNTFVHIYYIIECATQKGSLITYGLNWKTKHKSPLPTPQIHMAPEAGRPSHYSARPKHNGSQSTGNSPERVSSLNIYTAVPPQNSTFPFQIPAQRNPPPTSNPLHHKQAQLPITSTDTPCPLMILINVYPWSSSGLVPHSYLEHGDKTQRNN